MDVGLFLEGIIIGFAIAAPVGIRHSDGDQSAKTTMYLIEPKTAKVWLTWKQPP